MAEAAVIVERIRSRGANVVVNGDRLRIIHRGKLSSEALEYIRVNGKAVAAFLSGESAERDERAAIIEFGSGCPREWAEAFADILIRKRPPGISDLDWGWFITTCGRIIDEAPRVPGGAQ